MLVLQCVAEQIPEADEQAPSFARVVGDQAGDRVERVEQEVRLEVSAQPRELGGRPELLRFQTQLVGLERADARVLHREGEHEGERPEGIVGEPVHEPELDRARELPGPLRVGAQHGEVLRQEPDRHADAGPESAGDRDAGEDRRRRAEPSPRGIGEADRERVPP